VLFASANLLRNPAKWSSAGFDDVAARRAGTTFLLMSSIKIRNCVFAFRCNKRWEDLARTEQRGVKFCDDCSKEVFWCATDADLARAVRQGRCVAIRVDAGAASEAPSRLRKTKVRGEETMLGVVLPPGPKSDDDFYK
jgi:hypothetical protein